MAQFIDLTKTATDKVWHLDRIVFGLSPYLTPNETDIIIDRMETYGRSKIEGNWTIPDCYQFLKDVLGHHRFEIIMQLQNAEIIENQRRLLNENKSR